MHPIIQAEVDELMKTLEKMETSENRFHCDNCRLLTKITLEQFLSAALHRAIEKAGKEMVPPEEQYSNEVYRAYTNGFNECRSDALSKLDTIINFKE